MPRPLQGRAPAGARAGAQSRLELPGGGHQRRVHGAGRRRGRFRIGHRHLARRGLSRLAGGRGRAGPRPGARLCVCGERLQPPAHPDRCAATTDAPRRESESLCMNLLVKARREGRSIVEVTPRSAGWKYVGFAAYRLEPGETVTLAPDTLERCIVVLTGTVTVRAGGDAWT